MSLVIHGGRQEPGPVITIHLSIEGSSAWKSWPDGRRQDISLDDAMAELDRLASSARARSTG